MILTKVNHGNGNTYVTVRSSAEEILVITIQGRATVEINSNGNALSVKPAKE